MQAGHCIREAMGVVRMNDGLDHGDGVMQHERSNARADDRLPDNCAVLLGQRPTRSQATSGGDNYGRNFDFGFHVRAGPQLVRINAVAPPNGSRDRLGIFAVQHLRLRRNWLNSKQK
jgi:hypothetical protein